MIWLWIFAATGLSVWISYLFPLLTCLLFHRTQNLKRKYNATWALVTGGSTGIGRAIVRQLAGQGMNVVVVALPDEWLEQCRVEQMEEFPGVEFRWIGVDLGTPISDDGGYLNVIEQATNDIDIQLVFLNAGFATLRAVHKTSMQRLDANVHCNAVSPLRLARTFIEKMVDKDLKGCICFTSSAAAYLPAPAQSIYSATKAFVSQIAACLHIECSSYGIDVLAIHPGYTVTRLLEGQPRMHVMSIMEKWPATPEYVANFFFKSVGRGFAWVDVGLYSFITRLAVKHVDANVICAFLKVVMPWMPDYRLNPDLF